MFPPLVAEQLHRVIGGWASYTLVTGSMLGVGIFLAPPIVAEQLQSGPLFWLMWLSGGIISLCGGVAYAELGAMIPQSGGDFVFQRLALNRSTAFASGWVMFGAIVCSSIAAMSVALCQYQFPVLLGRPLDEPIFHLFDHPIASFDLLAIGLVILFTIINSFNVKVAARLQTVLSLTPIAIFGVLAIVGMFIPAGDPVAYVPDHSAPITSNGLLVSFEAIYFAYAGWPTVSYVAGEVKNPERNIPRALIGGTLTVTLLYMLLCAVFVHFLGLKGLSTAGEAGSATAQVFAGQGGKLFFTVVMTVALFAAINATVLGGARILYAMALAGSPHAHAPVRALWIQAAWTCLLLLSGRFVALVEMCSSAMLLIGSLTVISVFVLRRRRPEMLRPYRATGYPVIPALYLVASFFVLVGIAHRSFYDHTVNWHPFAGILIFLGAYAVDRILRRGHSSEPIDE